ncbi:hypothetical protein CANCADRAFT_31927 [Tortispora caseinolytica NRRL Y-17796]|uniref:Kinetochore protein NDC80 n=1 Tax=Tortispora caseinolytica NRRL Y-17796 TaxID=767744 RepID=A0A1E4THJ1_9ASCO|nr:hypothetical protein CANCADRAFT_31927 [Tortispora caseinolytica NRRL Y-17796]
MDNNRRSMMEGYDEYRDNSRTGALHTLDGNAVHSRASMIPQPSSAFKPAVSRTSSIARPSFNTMRDPQSTIGYGGDSNSGFENANVRSYPSSMRHSLAPALSHQRMSLAPSTTSHRTSMAPSTFATPGRTKHSKSSMSASFGGGTTKDMRPLRDRGYLVRMAQKVYDYLSNNDFESEMNHSLTVDRLFKSPTQKDFVLSFQWLYLRLDPGNKFVKSHDQEIFSVLKSIGYPYMENISRNQLSSIGSSSSWRFHLAILAWLVDMNLIFDCFDAQDYEKGPEIEQHMNGLAMNQLPNKYLPQMYQCYLLGSPKEEEFQEELIAALDERMQIEVANAETLRTVNGELKTELNTLKKSSRVLAEAIAKSEALDSDLVKFKAYIEHTERRKERWPSQMIKLKETEQEQSAKLRELSQQREQFLEQIASRGLTIADIDRLNSQHEALLHAQEVSQKRLESFVIQCSEKERDLRAIYERVEQAVASYNSLAHKQGIFPLYDGVTIKLTVNSPFANGELDVGIVPSVQSIIGNSDLKVGLRQVLQEFRKSIVGRKHKAEDEVVELEEEVDRVQEQLKQLSVNQDVLSKRLNQNRESQEQLLAQFLETSQMIEVELGRLEKSIRAKHSTESEKLIQKEQDMRTKLNDCERIESSIEETRINLTERTVEVVDTLTEVYGEMQQEIDGLLEFLGSEISE